MVVLGVFVVVVLGVFVVVVLGVFVVVAPREFVYVVTDAPLVGVAVDVEIEMVLVRVWLFAVCLVKENAEK